MLVLTRCLICGEGERAGAHDWKTGWTKKPFGMYKNGHEFVNNNTTDSENEYGFKDRFVANQHKKEQV